MKHHHLITFLAASSFVTAYEVAPSSQLPPSQCQNGQFWLDHWYQRGEANHNPAYEKRLRVNPPEVVLHEKFGPRVEARENGLMLIKSEESLFQIAGAELYLEMWGGHPGTAGKRVSFNGRHTYLLPELASLTGHCSYSYPAITIPKGDMVNGYNAVQLALDQGTTFWGHMMVDEASLRTALLATHPLLEKSGLSAFAATVSLSTTGDSKTLTLKVAEELAKRIASVDYQAYYTGYDENGNMTGTDWHGFTHNRKAGAFATTADKAPFTATWDTSMLPAQKNVAVRAFVRFAENPDLVYITGATDGHAVADRKDATVHLYQPTDLPTSFWSRDNNKKVCKFQLDVAPEQIEKAELHVVTWTGGPGTIKDYFTLNGQHFAVAEGEEHLPHYAVMPVKPGLLKAGENTIELLSDTVHHGIEVCHPGPALVIRSRQ
jgi:hypothetical protein